MMRPPVALDAHTCFYYLPSRSPPGMEKRVKIGLETHIIAIIA